MARSSRARKASGRDHRGWNLGGALWGISTGKEGRVIIHFQETKEAKEGLSEDGVRFVKAIASESASTGETVLEGSWLIFQ